MEDESEAFTKAIVLSIKSRPSRPKKPPTKYQDSLNSLEDIRSEDQLSSEFYIILVCIITDMYCVFDYKSRGLF